MRFLLSSVQKSPASNGCHAHTKKNAKSLEKKATIKVMNNRSLFERPFRPYFDLCTPLSGYKFSKLDTRDASISSYNSINIKTRSQLKTSSTYSENYDNYKSDKKGNSDSVDSCSDSFESSDHPGILDKVCLDDVECQENNETTMTPLPQLLPETNDVTNWFARLLRTLAEIEARQKHTLTAPALHKFLTDSVAAPLRLAVNEIMKRQNKDLTNPVVWSQCLLETVYTPAQLRRDLRTVGARLHRAWNGAGGDVPQNAIEHSEFVELHKAYLKYYRTPSGFSNVVLAQLPEPLSNVVEVRLYEKGVLKEDGQIKGNMDMEALATALSQVFSNSQEFSSVNINSESVMENNSRLDNIHKTNNERFHQRISQWESTEGHKKLTQKTVKISSQFIIDRLDQASSNSGSTIQHSESATLVSQLLGDSIPKTPVECREKPDIGRASNSENGDNSTSNSHSRESSSDDICSFVSCNKAGLYLQYQKPPPLQVWTSPEFVAATNDLFLPI
jgi:hypothetical protein